MSTPSITVYTFGSESNPNFRIVPESGNRSRDKRVTDFLTDTSTVLNNWISKQVKNGGSLSTAVYKKMKYLDADVISRFGEKVDFIHIDGEPPSTAGTSIVRPDTPTVNAAKARLAETFNSQEGLSDSEVTHLRAGILHDSGYNADRRPAAGSSDAPSRSS